MVSRIEKIVTKSNSKSHRMVGCHCFRVKIGINALKLLGNEVVIKKTDTGFEISRYNIDSKGRASILTISGVVTIPNRFIEEHEDLIDYNIDLDYESECVYLIRK